MEYIDTESFLCNFQIDDEYYVIYEDDLENIKYGKIIINDYGIQEIIDLSKEEYINVEKIYNYKFKDILSLGVIEND